MPDKPIYDLQWQERAACRGTDPAPWRAAEVLASGLHAHDRRLNAAQTVQRVYAAHLKVAAALATCQSCPVTGTCRERWAQPDHYTGVAGGLLVREGEVLADIIAPEGANEGQRRALRTYMVTHAITASGATPLTPLVPTDNAIA